MKARELAMFVNGGSSGAIENTTTNTSANTTSPNLNFDTVETNPTYESPSGENQFANFEDYLTDSTVNIGIAHLLNGTVSETTQLFTNNKDMILSVFEEYKEELEDKSSRIYELFNFLTENTNQNKYLLLVIFFRSLRKNFFEMDDFFNFLDSNELDLSFENIVVFLTSIKRYKAKVVRQRLELEPYPVYGNFFNFINTLFNSDSSIFYNEEESTTKVLEENTAFLLKPRINYLSLSDYRNFREAEEDYWTKVLASGFEEEAGLVLDRSKVIAGMIKDRYYKDTPYGIPVLMKKQIQKFLYFDNGFLDEIFVSIMKNSYNKLSYNDVSIFISQMCTDIVEFYDESEVLAFDYSADSNDLPDLNAFLAYKIAKILEKDRALITLKGIKEIKFYVHIILPFLGATSSNLQQINSQVDSDFSILRTRIENLRQYLLTNGKFTE